MKNKSLWIPLIIAAVLTVGLWQCDVLSERWEAESAARVDAVLAQQARDNPPHLDTNIDRRDSVAVARLRYAQFSAQGAYPNASDEMIAALEQDFAKEFDQKQTKYEQTALAKNGGPDLWLDAYPEMRPKQEGRWYYSVDSNLMGEKQRKASLQPSSNASIKGFEDLIVVGNDGERNVVGVVLGIQYEDAPVDYVRLKTDDNTPIKVKGKHIRSGSIYIFSMDNADAVIKRIASSRNVVVEVVLKDGKAWQAAYKSDGLTWPIPNTAREAYKTSFLSY